MKTLPLLALIPLLLASCASAPEPRRWPPANRPEWKALDPALCHPFPCRTDDPTVEWPGEYDNLPSGSAR